MPIYTRNKSSCSNGAITVPSNFQFTSIANRDTYFTNNPSRLKEDIYSTVTISGTTTLYHYSQGNWIDITVAIKGLSGDKGLDGAKVISASFVGQNLVFTLSDATTVTLNDAVNTLKGQKGDTGSKGDQGDIGPVGPKGNDGLNSIS